MTSEYSRVFFHAGQPWRISWRNWSSWVKTRKSRLCGITIWKCSTTA